MLLSDPTILFQTLSLQTSEGVNMPPTCVSECVCFHNKNCGNTSFILVKVTHTYIHILAHTYVYIF